MFAASLPGHRIAVNDRGSVTCLASWSMRCALGDSKCVARRPSFALSDGSPDSEGLANKDRAFSDVEYASASARGPWVAASMPSAGRHVRRLGSIPAAGAATASGPGPPAYSRDPGAAMQMSVLEQVTSSRWPTLMHVVPDGHGGATVW